MISAILAIAGALTAYKAVLVPLLTGLIGLLIPSPLQKQQQVATQILAEDAEIKKTGRPK